MCRFIDRIGEINYNNFGSEMKIVNYNSHNDVDILFTEYNYLAKNKCYAHFKNGKVKCPYEKRYYSVGYLGEGKYKVNDKSNKQTKQFKAWIGMLRRCYNQNSLKERERYTNVIVCEEWHNYQNFAEWYDNNFYTVNDEKMCLDKDILVKGNKVYSPNTCVYVPNNINMLFSKRNKSRGQFPIGVHLDKKRCKFISQCHNSERKYVNLGAFDNVNDAFLSYKKFKEKTIKEVADKYKKYIPNKLYKIMYIYEVDVND